MGHHAVRRRRGGGRSGRLREGARARWGASATARRSGPGCSRSSRTRRATACGPPGRRAGLALRVAEERRPDDAVPSPEAALLDSEQRDQLLAAIERLPEASREAIACRYLLDLSEEETAAALDCPRGTVKSRVSRALERLRAELERRWRRDRPGAAAHPAGPRARLATPRPISPLSLRDRLAPAPRVRRRPVLFRRSFAIAIAALLMLAGGVFAAVPSVRARGARVLRAARCDGRAARAPAAGAAEPRPPAVGERTTLDRTRARCSASSRWCRPPPATPDACSSTAASRAGGCRSSTARGATCPRRRARGSACSWTSSAATSTPSTRARWPARPPASSRSRSTASARSGWRARRTSSSTGRLGTRFEERRLRLAQNVLLLEHGRLLVRLEGAFGRARAIELARSLEAG